MVSFFKTIPSTVLLFLCLFCNGWIVPRDSSVSTILRLPEWMKHDGALFRRQYSTSCSDQIVDPQTPDCVALCAPANDACSSSDVRRRSYVYPPGRPTKLWNKTTVSSKSPTLLKRTFNQLLQTDLPTYLPDQFDEDKYDPDFGLPTLLIDFDDGVDTDHTVVDQRTFDTDTFQIGSPNMHGCTVVTVVSNRAVYMGHFWERPTWSGPAFEFRERIINFLKTTGTTFGVGPRFNPDLFNHPGDNSRVYIMTPRRSQTPDDYTRATYSNKLATLISTIQAALPGVNIAQWNYIRLDYDIGAERREAGTNQRGFALFQFDPNAYGPGQQGWRLFYEEIPFQSDRPPPGLPVTLVPPLPPLPADGE